MTSEDVSRILVQMDEARLRARFQDVENLRHALIRSWEQMEARLHETETYLDELRHIYEDQKRELRDSAARAS